VLKKANTRYDNERSIISNRRFFSNHIHLDKIKEI